jgi:hypothetical protein
MLQNIAAPAHAGPTRHERLLDQMAADSLYWRRRFKLPK